MSVGIERVAAGCVPVGGRGGTAPRSGASAAMVAASMGAWRGRLRGRDTAEAMRRATMAAMDFIVMLQVVWVFGEGEAGKWKARTSSSGVRLAR